MTDPTSIDTDVTERSNGTAPQPLPDTAELALRDRITVLEEWRPDVDRAIGLLALGGIAAAMAMTLLLVLIRRRR